VATGCSGFDGRMDGASISALKQQRSQTALSKKRQLPLRSSCAVVSRAAQGGKICFQPSGLSLVDAVQLPQ
jgi:hypothetical protein